VMTDQLHQDVMRIWEETKKTIVMVSHNFEEAVLLSDRIAVIRSVHVADGPPVLTPEQLDALHNACSSVPAPKTLREIVGWPRKSQSAPSSSPGPSSSPPTAPSPAPSARAK